MQCGSGSSVGDRLVENYTGLLPMLWKAVLRYKESRSGSGSYEKLGDRNDDGIDQWGSGGKLYYSAKSSSSSIVSSSRRRRWRVMFQVPKVQGWGGRAAPRPRRHQFLQHGYT